MSPVLRLGYNRGMSRMIAKATLLTLAFIIAATNSYAQVTPRHKRERRAVEPLVPAVPIDKRDSVVAVPGAFAGRPYWLALAQCGGIYFRLNVLYTDAAVRARVVKPDPRANAEFTRKLNEAIRTATTYFDGAEHLLMNDRGIERADAVLTYEAHSRTTGERLKTVEAALAEAKACPALYQACQQAYPKLCYEPLPPTN